MPDLVEDDTYIAWVWHSCCFIRCTKWDRLTVHVEMCRAHNPEASVYPWAFGIAGCVEKGEVLPGSRWDDWTVEWNYRTDARRIADGHRVDIDPPNPEVSTMRFTQTSDMARAFLDFDPQRAKGKTWREVLALHEHDAVG